MLATSVKLFLDDKRHPPSPIGWWLARSAAEAIQILENHSVSEISFDHDLGSSPEEATKEPSGYVVACYIEDRARAGTIPRMKWDIHSWNPVGRKRIEAAMQQAEKYWDSLEQ